MAPPTSAASLAVTSGYAASVTDTFVIIENDGADPVVSTFAGLPNGMGMTIGGQDFWIYYDGGTGNDVVLSRSAPPPPKVSAVQIGDGTTQRSRVTSFGHDLQRRRDVYRHNGRGVHPDPRQR